jgi:hypothetical protein
MSNDVALPPDIAALIASPEYQAQMALLTQQAAAQLAALIESLRAAEAAIGTPPPPPVDQIPDGLPWEPGIKLPVLEGAPAPEFLAPAVEPLPAEPTARDLLAKALAALSIEPPPAAIADLAPTLAAPLAALTEPAALPAGAGPADDIPAFDSFTTWTGAEGTGV